MKEAANVPDTREAYTVEDAIREEVGRFAVAMEQMGARTDSFPDGSEYWIIRSGENYDGSRMVYNKKASPRRSYNLDQRLIVHKHGALDIATATDIYKSVYQPNYKESIAKMFKFDKLDDEGKDTLYGKFLLDLANAQARYLPKSNVVSENASSEENAA